MKPDEPARDWLHVRWKHRRIALFLLIGIAVRLRFVARSAYPLGEGGLFYYIIQYIAERGQLPVEVPYYSCGFPFVYPPLGFILYALPLRLAGATSPISLFVLMKWGSFLFSSLALLIFVPLARRLLPGRARAWEFAVLSFATLPSIVWHNAAADSIRNLAFCFLLGGLWASHKALTDESPGKWTIAAGLLAGAAINTHPPAALGLVLVIGLFAVYYGWAAFRSGGWRSLLGKTAIAAVIFSIAAVVMLPWLLAIYKSHGPGFITILRNGFSSQPHATIWIFSLLQFGSTREPFAHLWAVLGVLGMVYTWVCGSPLLAIWFLITPLHWSDHIVSLPLTLGAGAAVGELIWPQIQKGLAVERKAGGALLALLVGYATLSALSTPAYRELRPQVTGARLAAWEWMSSHLDPAAAESERAWVVIIGEDVEWVPAFARVCANIPQGSEWTGHFLEYIRMHNAFETASTYDEFSQILRHYEQPVDYLYVSAPTSGGSFPAADETAAYDLDAESLRHRMAFARDVEQQTCVKRVFSNAEVILYDLRECPLSVR